jgi:hypothetical protein
MRSRASGSKTKRIRAVFGAAIVLGLGPAGAAAQIPSPPVPPLASSSLAAGRSCPGAGPIAVGCLVNKARRRAGLRRFAWNRALARAATRHARDMARRGYFAHQRPGGPSPGRRTRAAGFRARDVGEAIAYGCGSFGTPPTVVRMWLESPPHRAILLSRRSRVGVGVTGRPPLPCGGSGATYVLDAG